MSHSTLTPPPRRRHKKQRTKRHRVETPEAWRQTCRSKQRGSPPAGGRHLVFREMIIVQLRGFFIRSELKTYGIVKLDHATPSSRGEDKQNVWVATTQLYIGRKMWTMERSRLWINVVYSCIYRLICLDIFCPIGDMICLFPCNF